MPDTSGSVKFFNQDRGYGFIIPDGGGPDVFCHIKDLRQTGVVQLKENQRVNFDTAPGRDGKLKAVNLSVAL